MKIDFNQKIMQLDGRKPIFKTPPPEKGESKESKEKKPKEPLLLKDVAIEALLQIEQNSTGEDKVKRYDLALRIQRQKEGPVDLESNEVANLKELIAKIYGPLVVGQAWKMLEKKAPEIVQ